MYNKYNIEKINFFIALALVFMFPLSKKVVVYLSVLWLISYIIEGDFINKWLRIKKNSLLLIPVGLYFLHVISLFYSTDIHTGLFDLEVKQTMFFFPIMLASANNWYEKKYILILKSFIIGCLVASVLCLLNALWKHSDNFDYFFYTYFSIFHHPSYFAMYLTIAIIFLFFIQHNSSLSAWSIIGIYGLVVFFVFIIYLLSSKAGIISTLIILFTLGLIAFFNYRKPISTLVFLFLFSLLLLSIKYNIRFETKITKSPKIENSTATSIANKTHIAIAKTYTAQLRFEIWNIAFDLIRNNFIIGTGIGDVKNELVKKYKEKKFIDAYEKKTNAHNQFIETFIALGVIGFTVLLLFFAIPFYIAIKQKQIISIFFLFILAFHFLFETMLNTMAGTVFISFFYGFLVFVKNSKDKEA